MSDGPLVKPPVTASAPPAAAAGAGALPLSRPAVAGKFLVAGGQKFYARGVTYGPFRPDAGGCAYHTPEVVRRDFAAMAAHGINAVRTYTRPPRWLLDAAAEHGLRVMVGVGLAGEQLSAFLDDRRTTRAVRRRCADDVRACAGHPAVLAYVVGNEIPGTIVRWYGRRRVERFVRDLCDLARENDPAGLVTYVNYPTTEYLQLPFLDFLSYNVYLEDPERFRSYLARLQSLADYKPLLMAEVGLTACGTVARGRPSRSAGSSAPRSPPGARARSSSPGPTSGTPGARRWRTGRLG
jgi:hypothetical protein